MSGQESILYLVASVLLGIGNVWYYWLPDHLAEKRRARAGRRK